ncbi:hypothetical protein Tco_0700610 [Tanacetum coccineum]
MEKSIENADFAKIVDFLNANPIRYALTIHAKVEGKTIVILESSVRRDLQFDDEDGIACLTNTKIFENLQLMGYEKLSEKLTFYKPYFSPQWKYLIHTILQCLSSKSTAWNEFGTNIASAVICLAKNQKFNFSKLIFDGMMRNLDSSKKFLMYPRFLQLFLNKQIENLSEVNVVYDTPSHTKKIFANMRRQGKDFSGTVTPLFSSMLAQQADMGEGSGQPTDPQHTSTSAQPSNEEPITVPSSSQPKKTHRPRKAKRATEISQFSGPIPLVADETVTKEREDIMERAATTASSLEAEVNILGSREDRLKLKELMELCTKLSDRVHNLETTKTAQAKKIASLKKRVKKLERKRKPKTLGMNLFKIDTSTRRSLGFDADIDEVFKDVEGDAEQVIRAVADEVSTGDTVNTAGTEVNTTSVPVTTAGVSVTTAEPITTASVNITTAEPTTPPTTTTIFEDEGLTITQTLVKMRSEKSKEEAFCKTYSKRAKKTTTNQSSKEESNHLKNKIFDEVQKAFDKTMSWIYSFLPVDSEVVKGSKDRAEGRETRAEGNDGDDVTIDATPLSVKIPIVDYKIYQEGKKSFFQIIRADGKTQMYLTFSKMLKNFDREDLEVLWRIVKARFKKTEPVNYMDTFLHLNLKTMFEHHVEDSIWKNQQGLVKVLNWKLFDSCGVHCVTVQPIPYYLLVKKMYPLTKHTLHQMFNYVKLQFDYECEMAFDLLR